MGLEASPELNSLPIVDLANPDIYETARVLRKACMEVGFFYLVNHGIDQELIDELFDQSKRFFALSLDEKMKVLADEKFRGYTPFDEELLDPGNQSRGDSKEGYYIGFNISSSHPRSTWPLHGPNQWPSPVLQISKFVEAMKNILEQYLTSVCNQKSSERLPQWRETMEVYFEKALKLGVRLASMLAVALNMEATYFEKAGTFDCPMAALRLLHYSDENSNPEEGLYGCGAHSDYGLLTLLTTDNVPGLQICRDKNAASRVWEDVTPMKGAYIVNLGDMLERWSNGLFRSTLHRVVTSGTERYSVPFFFEPNFDTLVQCLPSCCSETNPPQYPPITSGQHLLAKYRATHANFEAGSKMA